MLLVTYYMQHCLVELSQINVKCESVCQGSRIHIKKTFKESPLRFLNPIYLISYITHETLALKDTLECA